MPRVDVSMTPREVQAFLEQPMTAVLATVGLDGFPHLTGMWFVVHDEAMLMWTYRKAQKAANLRRDSSCAALVEQGTAYDELRGVMVRGDARLIDEHEHVVEIGRMLYERYTLPRTGIGYGDGPRVEIERQATKRVGIAVPMQRMASWDHRKLGSA